MKELKEVYNVSVKGNKDIIAAYAMQQGFEPIIQNLSRHTRYIWKRGTKVVVLDEIHYPKGNAGVAKIIAHHPIISIKVQTFLPFPQ